MKEKKKEEDLVRTRTCDLHSLLCDTTDSKAARLKESECEACLLCAAESDIIN